MEAADLPTCGAIGSPDNSIQMRLWMFARG